MPDSSGRQRVPVVARAVRCLGVEQLEGSDARAPARSEQRGHPGRGEPGQVAFDDQRLHRAASAAVRRDWPASGGGTGAPPAGRAASVERPEGQEGLAAPVRLVPVLDVPPPPAGDGGQLGLGVDGHREADRLQHREVAGRVGVGHGLLEPEALGLGVVGEHQGPGLADGRQGLEPTGEDAVLHAQLGAHDLVEERAEGLDHEVERPGDEDGPVPERLVGPDPGDARRERLGQQQVVEEVPPVVPEPGGGAPS